MKTIFSHFFQNLAGCFRGRNLLWHGIAVLLTALIVMSGFDWQYFLLTRNETLLSFFFPAVVIGGMVPILGPAIILVFGLIKNNAKTIKTAWATSQAELIGWIVSSMYKAVTGRIPPPHHIGGLDISHQFEFGLLRNGIFWGWPSSHTTIAFAMVFALLALFPKNRYLAYGGLIYALYIGFGISMTIHWFSEFIAGAIIGAVVGTVVGRYFQNASNEAKGK